MSPCVPCGCDLEANHVCEWHTAYHKKEEVQHCQEPIRTVVDRGPEHITFTIKDSGQRQQGDPRFHALLKEMGELHDKKQADYGSATDPFANVRASEAWGIAPWIGALIRLNDKVKRLQAFARKGTLANESAEDSMMDVAVYALIALILYRE